MSIKTPFKGHASEDVNEINDVYDAVIEYEVSRREQQGQPGHPWLKNAIKAKSALYSRLKSGKLPMVFPPPASFSYPWYEVVESDKELFLIDAHFPMSGSNSGGAGGYDVIIHQDRWRLIRQTSENTWMVSYRDWEGLGFTWELRHFNLPATETEATILPRHNPALKRIVNAQQLDDLAEYLVNKWVESLSAANASPEARTKTQAGANKLKGLYERASLQKSREELEFRRKQGLPDTPSPLERTQRKLEYKENILGNDWFLGEDDLIYRKQWSLKRIKPAAIDPTEIYIDPGVL